MQQKPLYIALAISVIVNIVIFGGLVTMAASDSASGAIARQFHLVARDQVPDVPDLTSEVDDLSSRLDDLETGGGDQASQSVDDVSSSMDDLSSRVDDLETGNGDEAASSLDDLDARVSDLESRVDELCLSVESAIC